MKHLSRWTAAFLALLLALMSANGAFAETLPVEEQAELFGSRGSTVWLPAIFRKPHRN